MIDLNIFMLYYWFSNTYHSTWDLIPTYWVELYNWITIIDTLNLMNCHHTWNHLSLRQLKIHDKNYPANDLELAAFVFSFNNWRTYLYGIHGNIFSDQKSLKYVFNKKDLNLCQRRWLDLFKDYDIRVIYTLLRWMSR